MNSEKNIPSGPWTTIFTNNGCNVITLQACAALARGILTSDREAKIIAKHLIPGVLKAGLFGSKIWIRFTFRLLFSPVLVG
jgi:hypothetical protein